MPHKGRQGSVQRPSEGRGWRRGETEDSRRTGAAKGCETKKERRRYESDRRGEGIVQRENGWNDFLRDGREDLREEAAGAGQAEGAEREAKGAEPEVPGRAAGVQGVRHGGVARRVARGGEGAGAEGLQPVPRGELRLLRRGRAAGRPGDVPVLGGEPAAAAGGGRGAAGRAAVPRDVGGGARHGDGGGGRPSARRLHPRGGDADVAAGGGRGAEGRRGGDARHRADSGRDALPRLRLLRAGGRLGLLAQPPLHRGDSGGGRDGREVRRRGASFSPGTGDIEDRRAEERGGGIIFQRRVRCKRGGGRCSRRGSGGRRRCGKACGQRRSGRSPKGSRRRRRPGGRRRGEAARR